MNFLTLYLRMAIGLGFLSAVADRFGLWPKEMSAWGNWGNFVISTKSLNPFLPESLISITAIAATGAELVLGLCLIIGFKTRLFAKLSGFLLLFFALAMTFSTGIKSAFDYSVFIASAGAFALSTMQSRFLEIDNLLSK